MGTLADVADGPVDSDPLVKVELARSSCRREAELVRDLHQTAARFLPLVVAIAFVATRSRASRETGAAP